MTRELKHTGLTAEIRRIVAEATAAGKWITVREVYDQCTTADGVNGVATTIHDLHGRGELVREAQRTGRFGYRMSDGKAPRPPVPAGPSAPANPAAVERRVKRVEHSEGVSVVETTAPAPAPAPSTPAPPTAKPFAYDLYDHLSSALGDLDDLAGDVVDKDAPRPVIKAVLAAQGSLRRAQEALIQAERAAR